MSAADGPSTHQDRQRLVLRLAELGVPTTDTNAQRHVAAVWTDGRARRRSDLTRREAGSLYAYLQTATADELVEWLSRPDPGAKPPAPAMDPAACLASWDDVVAVAAQVSVTEPEEPPAVEDPDACPWCSPEDPPDTPCVCRPELPPVDPFAVEPAPLPEPTPAPVHVVTYEPAARTPEEIEAAAEAAVERFRERRDAGVVLQPPSLSSIPPRVVVPHTAPGRYCMTRCYCGGCPPYAEQIAEAERTHAREVRAALSEDRNTSRRR